MAQERDDHLEVVEDDDELDTGEDGEELEEYELDPEVAARRAAALAHIRRFGDPVLKSRAAEVERFDDGLRQQVERMAQLMGDALGVGLAAPQIGVSQRLLVYRIGHDAPIIALANPEIEWHSGDEEPAEEGCLSIPGVVVDVERPVHVRVRALDEQGKPRLVEASGLEARVIQHELDHLNGVLILDRASKEQRRDAIRALREQEQQQAA
jgi:peptide deformylase